MEKIPLTIITGYLGAGKTTLLRKLLDHAAATGLRLAVVMNEFGAIGIDQEIIKGKNFDLVELPGGCVCCSLSGEFDAALLELAGRPNPPEHIVVETTGLAEPDALVVDLEQASEGVRIESVVTVVDCDALVRSPSLGHTGQVQVEMADLIVLNKADLVTKEQLDSVRQEVSDLNQRAIVVSSSASKPVDPALILDSKSGPRETHKLLHQNPHEHMQGADSIVVECNQPLSEERFREFAYGIPQEVYRAKGFVCFDDGRTMLFNYVSGRFSLEEWEQEKDATQVVFIAPLGMSDDVKGQIETGLIACSKD
jgi:G3E family GTPase